MTQPDAPFPSITTQQLESVRDAATAYMQECSDNPPLTDPEQSVAMALVGAMPTRVRQSFGDTDQARLAWVVASCYFLRMCAPSNPRRAAMGLYRLLDDIEMTSPAAWAETYGAVEQLLRDGGIDPTQIEQDGPTA